MKSTFAFVALTYGKDCTSQIKEVALQQRRRFLLESYKKEVKIATEFLGGVFVEKLGAIRIQRRSLRKLASLNRKLEFWYAYGRPRVTDLPGLYGVELNFNRQLKGAIRVAEKTAAELCKPSLLPDGRVCRSKIVSAAVRLVCASDATSLKKGSFAYEF